MFILIKSHISHFPFSFYNESSKKNKPGANGNEADDDEDKDEDKDEHDEEKLRKARDWDEWKDSTKIHNLILLLFKTSFPKIFQSVFSMIPLVFFSTQFSFFPIEG